MDVQTFWNVIGQYNQNTIIIQVMLLILTVIALSLSYTNKVACLAKLMLGIANLFIGIMFFGYYGTQPIQKYFAFPLYLICGFCFYMNACTIKMIYLKDLIYFKLYCFCYIVYIP